jgi:hypothetical protein
MTFHQTKMAWEEVTVPCMKGVWHKIRSGTENFGTNCDNLYMMIKEISEIAEVGLDNPDSVGITEVLESHSRPLSNEELYNLAQQLTEQQKEDEDEGDRGTREMQRTLLIFFPLQMWQLKSYVILILTGKATVQ